MHLDYKACAAILAVLSPDRSAMTFNDLLADGQAKSRAAVGNLRRKKEVKHPLQGLRRDAWAGVLNGKTHGTLALGPARLFIDSYRQQAAVFHCLDRIDE